MSLRFKVFCAGILFESALKSIQQDIHGKEAYLKIVDAGWVSAWITVPMAIIFIIFAIFLYNSD